MEEVLECQEQQEVLEFLEALEALEVSNMERVLEVNVEMSTLGQIWMKT